MPRSVRGTSTSKQWKSRYPKQRTRGNTSEGPQFEVTGQHVIIFVALVFAAAWAAGLLPEQSLNSNELAPSAFMHGGAVDSLLVGEASLGGAALLLKAPEDDFHEVLHRVP